MSRSYTDFTSPDQENKWEEGFTAYDMKRSRAVSEKLAAFGNGDDQRLVALLDVCGGLKPGGYGATPRVMDWRFFEVADLDGLVPTPSSFLVRRVGWLLALKLKQVKNATRQRKKFRTMIDTAVKSGLSRSALGNAAELAVMTALNMEKLLPVSLLTEAGLELPGFLNSKKKKPHMLELDLKLFTDDLPELPNDKVTLLVPTSKSFKSVDAVLTYYTKGDAQVIVGIQVYGVICFLTECNDAW